MPDVGGDVFGAVANLLGATTTATVATGILNLWMHTPEETAARHAALTAEHGRRFLVGIGVSHGPLIDRVKEAGTYQQAAGADAAPTSTGSTPPTRRWPPTTGCSPRSARRCSSWPAPAPPAPTRTS